MSVRDGYPASPAKYLDVKTVTTKTVITKTVVIERVDIKRLHIDTTTTLIVMEDEVDRLVAAWRRERPDLDVEPLEVLSRVSRLARHLDRARRLAFSEHTWRRRTRRPVPRW